MYVINYLKIKIKMYSICKHISIKTGTILLDISGKIIQTLQNNAQKTFLKRKIFL
jgi:hypothetical protein